jgi:hypothetical protein
MSTQQPVRKPTSLWPTSTLGWWVVGEGVVFVVALAGLLLATALGQTGGNTFSDNWWLAGPAMIAGVAAVAGFVTSLWAATRARDRSMAVIIGLLVSTITIVFLLGEVISPH